MWMSDCFKDLIMVVLPMTITKYKRHTHSHTSTTELCFSIGHQICLWRLWLANLLIFAHNIQLGLPDLFFHSISCRPHMITCFPFARRIFTKIYRAELITTSCDVLNHVILHDKHILRETREHPSTTMLNLMSCCSTSGCCPLIQV